MTDMAMPYFMTNKDWYRVEYDEEGDPYYVLTDKAPKKARESYDVFYGEDDFE